MESTPRVQALLIAGVGVAVLLGVLSITFAAMAAFRNDEHQQTLAASWGPGMMGPQMMGSSGYTWDHMRWMMGGFTTGSTALVEGSSSQTISMKDFAFSPGNVHVPVGAKVTWKDEDNAPHIAAAADGSWSTASLLKGQSATITFDKPGDYLYVCSYHPGMTGRLVVE